MFTLKGIYAPIATPFKQGRIAYDELEKNMDFWLSSRLEGIVVMGSNGEAVSLTEKEKEELIGFCCQRARGKKRVIVGTGGNCAEETDRLNRISAQWGADAVLVVTPYYYKGSMKDPVLENYYTAVADASPLPVVLYNMPANTGVNMCAALQSRLSRHPNIIGVKDTGGSIAQISETIFSADPSFSVFAGNGAFLLPSLMMGAKGATLALANIAPNECAELADLAAAGQFDKAKELARRLMPVNAAVTTRHGVGGLKFAMDCVGLYGGEPRRPLLRPDRQTCGEIEGILRDAGLI